MALLTDPAVARHSPGCLPEWHTLLHAVLFHPCCWRSAAKSVSLSAQCANSPCAMQRCTWHKQSCEGKLHCLGQLRNQTWQTGGSPIDTCLPLAVTCCTRIEIRHFKQQSCLNATEIPLSCSAFVQMYNCPNAECYGVGKRMSCSAVGGCASRPNLEHWSHAVPQTPVLITWNAPNIKNRAIQSYSVLLIAAQLLNATQLLSAAQLLSATVSAWHHMAHSQTFACKTKQAYSGSNFWPFQLWGFLLSYLKSRTFKPSSAARKCNWEPLITNSVAEMSELSKSLDSRFSCLPYKQAAAQSTSTHRGNRVGGTGWLTWWEWVQNCWLKPANQACRLPRNMIVKR